MGNFGRKFKIALHTATPKELGQELVDMIFSDNKNDVEKARKLIEKGASLTEVDDIGGREHGGTALRWSLYRGYNDMSRLLIEKGSPVSIDDLVTAVTHGGHNEEGIDIIHTIVSKFTNPEELKTAVQVSLMAAIKNPVENSRKNFLTEIDFRIIQILIDHGACAADKDTPLLYLASRLKGNEKIALVDMLFKAGEKFEDAIEYANLHGSTGQIRFLQAHGQRLTGKIILTAMEKNELTDAFNFIQRKEDIIAEQEKVIDGLQALLNKKDTAQPKKNER